MIIHISHWFIFKNEVVLIAQEEVIFAVYMPWAFAYGDLNKLKLAITAPVAALTVEGDITVKNA